MICLTNEQAKATPQEILMLLSELCQLCLDREITVNIKPAVVEALSNPSEFNARYKK